MAIGTPTIITANPAFDLTTGSPSAAFTTNVQANTGDMVVVIASANANGIVDSVTDSIGGNTWTVDKTAINAGTNKSNVAICSTILQSNLTSGATITVHWNAAWVEAVVKAFKVTGMAASSYVDKTNSNNGTSTTADAGATGTLTQAAELIVVAYGSNGSPAPSAGTNYTIGTVLNVQGTHGRSLWGQYQIVAATTTQPTACSNSSVDFAGAVVTYKGATGSPPVNTVAPAVTGTTTVGQVLSSTTGTWTTSNPVYTYQWQRDVAGNGSFSNIGSATSSTYTLVDADDGNKVRCNVTDTDDNGNATAASNAVGLIIEPVPTNSVAPVASGATTVGSVVSTTNGTWANMGGSVATYAYQWQRDVLGGGSYSNIAAATSSSYTLVLLDDACHVRCAVTATNSGGAGTAANSNSILDTTPVPVVVGNTSFDMSTAWTILG